MFYVIIKVKWTLTSYLVRYTQLGETTLKPSNSSIYPSSSLFIYLLLIFSEDTFIEYLFFL